MNKDFKRIIRKVLNYFILALTVTVSIFAVSAIIEYKTSIKENARDKAAFEMEQYELRLDDTIEDILEEARQIYEQASVKETLHDVCIFLEDLTNERIKGNINSSFKYARYIKDGKIYKASQSEYISDGDDNKSIIDALDNDIHIDFVGVYKDQQAGMNLASIIIPHAKEGIYDGIVLYYVTDVFNALELDQSDVSNSVFLTTSIDECIKTLKNNASLDEKNISKTLLDKVTNNSDYASVNNFLKLNDTKYLIAEINYNDYILCSKKVESSTNLYLFGIYELDVLLAEEYAFYNAISATFYILLVVAAVLFAIIFFRKFGLAFILGDEKFNKRFYCLSHVGFKEEAVQTMNQNPNSQFALVISEIKFYNYIITKDAELEKKIIFYIKSFFNRNSSDRELFGYDSNGRLYFLIYAPNIDRFRQRLEELDKHCSQFVIDQSKKLELMHGITITTGSENFIKTLEHSQNALDETTSKIGLKNYEFYENENDNDKLNREFIELHIQEALDKGDFKVFYQPKYNMKQNKVDGAEALVRWFMPEEKTFYPPATFIPIIEENGFIVKVDHYVMEEVCKYLRQSLDRGEKVYPVSVNVSGITFAQNDFVETYCNIKKKYKIRDGLICLELTESALVKDIDILKNDIETFHKNGFTCSIDDFGTGFSSYASLKYLEFDEIKLDRFFLDQGKNAEYDQAILVSVINLGKKLGMKVTIEGVGDTEKLNYLKSLDCDVIQGFIYARPMPLADYISFTNGASRGSFN